MNFFIKIYKRNMSRKAKQVKEQAVGEKVLTSSPGVTGRWVSREVLIAAAFFRSLEARDLSFLTGASGAFTTAPASEEGGSFEAGVSAAGEVPVFPVGFSLSLRKK
jgi:hypothetical protein